jgi:hypothetical protein
LAIVTVAIPIAKSANQLIGFPCAIDAAG